MHTLRDEVEAVYQHPTLEPDEKRELLDRLAEKMVNTARRALGKPPLPSRFDTPAPSADLVRKRRSVPLPVPMKR